MGDDVIEKRRKIRRYETHIFRGQNVPDILAIGGDSHAISQPEIRSRRALSGEINSVRREKIISIWHEYITRPGVFQRYRKSAGLF